MGWNGGSTVMMDVIENLDHTDCPDEIRRLIYEILIPALEMQDWDTQSELCGEDSVYDQVLHNLHPEWRSGHDSE